MLIHNCTDLDNYSKFKVNKNITIKELHNIIYQKTNNRYYQLYCNDINLNKLHDRILLNNFNNDITLINLVKVDIIKNNKKVIRNYKINQSILVNDILKIFDCCNDQYCITYKGNYYPYTEENNKSIIIVDDSPIVIDIDSYKYKQVDIEVLHYNNTTKSNHIFNLNDRLSNIYIISSSIRMGYKFEYYISNNGKLNKVDLEDKIKDISDQNKCKLIIKLINSPDYYYSIGSLYIKTLTGKTITVHVDSSDTVYDIKCKIQDREGIPPSQSKLICSGYKLLDWVKLGSYNIVKDTCIYLVLQLRGGGGSEFIDISNSESRIVQQWSNKKLPSWRTVYQGLSIDGLCNNYTCEAFNEYVIYNHKLKQFTLDDIPNVKCPQCSSVIEVSSIMFNNCHWRWQGIKEDNPYKLENTDWELVDDHVVKFNKDISGSINWLSLTIDIKNKDLDYTYGSKILNTCNPTPDKLLCSICLESNELNHEYSELDCNHIFHKSCLDKWLTVNNTCPLCRKQCL
jgi:hypothetical protein